MKLTTDRTEQEEIQRKKNDTTYIPGPEEKKKWGTILLDIDGTVTDHNNTVSVHEDMSSLGYPVDRMVKEVRKLLNAGEDVRIFTARTSYTGPGRAKMIEAIDNLCRELFGQTMPIQQSKDLWTKAIIDDVAVQIIPDTGKRADGHNELIKE